MIPPNQNKRRRRWRGLLLALFAGLLLLLLARGMRGAGPNTSSRSIQVGGLARTFWLHVPPGLARDQPVPLVLVFHGGGGTAAFAERETRFSELADREGFLVAYPQGSGKSWNDGREAPVIPAQKNNVDDVAFIEALIDAVGKEHPVDSRRVFATGISNGGTFSHYLGARLSSRIAAIAPVAGGIAEPLRDSFKPDHPVSVLMIHGLDDPLVPYDGGEITLPGGHKRGRILPTEDSVRLWIDRDGCQQDPVKSQLEDADKADGCTAERWTYPGGKDGTEVVLCRIKGGGHTWPDGKQYLPARLVGNVCRDFNGGEAIWEFFKQHPRK